ncbi:acetyl-CoA carboxylase biotin carboxyl carrier protein [Glaciibacter sp. 2TAF33]|uniref:acetyl-CoA carboxylase biotin carboxyl carrier protein n=1 Tax=Glaciibacter sp. 2TAF33 TaxID=3233015 RepID=UPI003F92D314
MPLNPPDAKELQAIVDWVNLTDDVRELSIKFGDVELFISRDRQRPTAQPIGAPAPAPAAAPAASPAPTASPAPAESAPAAPAASAPAAVTALAHDEVLIKAPMVGTFYASPKPGSPAFVAVDDTVSAETVLCIVEVMKLMNNVEARVEGTVTQILVQDNQAVEYGQPLMVIKRAA